MVKQVDTSDDLLLNGDKTADRSVIHDMRNVYRSSCVRELFEVASDATGFSKTDVACLASYTEQDKDQLGLAKS
eukprot:3015912-Prymnesium_polylepis.2